MTENAAYVSSFPLVKAGTVSSASFHIFFSLLFVVPLFCAMALVPV
jgi:hypothetical protein